MPTSAYCRGSRLRGIGVQRLCLCKFLRKAVGFQHCRKHMPNRDVRSQRKARGQNFKTGDGPGYFWSLGQIHLFQDSLGNGSLIPAVPKIVECFPPRPFVQDVTDGGVQRLQEQGDVPAAAAILNCQFLAGRGQRILEHGEQVSVARLQCPSQFRRDNEVEEVMCCSRLPRTCCNVRLVSI